MATTLSAKGQEILADLPPYEQDDPYISALVDAIAREIARIDDFVAEVRAGLFPATTSGEYLTYWETWLDLPVDPAQSEESRREVVLAALRSRTLNAGTGWGGIMTAIIGSANWRYSENDPGSYEITFRIPLDAADYRAGVLIEYLRRALPAHLDFGYPASTNITWTVGGFRVGSEVGDTI
jgi:hypothetical protein